MIYFDLVTGGQQWSKPGVPDDVYTMTQSGVTTTTDVWGLNNDDVMTHAGSDVNKRKGCSFVTSVSTYRVWVVRRNGKGRL